MSNFTPGPWVVCEQYGTVVRRGGPVDLEIADCSTGFLNTPAGSYSIERDEAEANARLIAAAPDLLAALELAVGTVEHMYHTNHDPDGSLWADVLACRAAIRKATEGQP